jgi:hypothetical protein
MTDWVTTWLDGVEREADLLFKIADAKQQIHDYEDPLVNLQMGWWGTLEGHGPIRLSELRRIRQGFCRLFGQAYKPEWTAEEYQILGTSRQQLQERAERLRTAFPGLSQKYQGEV